MDTGTPGVLQFPATQYVADGQSMTYRSRWTPSDTAYEAWSEAQGKDGWVTMFKLTLKRVPIGPLRVPLDAGQGGPDMHSMHRVLAQVANINDAG